MVLMACVMSKFSSSNKLFLVCSSKSSNDEIDELNVSETRSIFSLYELIFAFITSLLCFVNLFTLIDLFIPSRIKKEKINDDMVNDNEGFIVKRKCPRRFGCKYKPDHGLDSLFMLM